MRMVFLTLMKMIFLALVKMVNLLLIRMILLTLMTMTLTLMTTMTTTSWRMSGIVQSSGISATTVCPTTSATTATPSS